MPKLSSPAERRPPCTPQGAAAGQPRVSALAESAKPSGPGTLPSYLSPTRGLLGIKRPHGLRTPSSPESAGSTVAAPAAKKARYGPSPQRAETSSSAVHDEHEPVSTRPNRDPRAQPRPAPRRGDAPSARKPASASSSAPPGRAPETGTGPRTKTGPRAPTSPRPTQTTASSTATSASPKGRAAPNARRNPPRAARFPGPASRAEQPRAQGSPQLPPGPHPVSPSSTRPSSQAASIPSNEGDQAARRLFGASQERSPNTPPAAPPAQPAAPAAAAGKGVACIFSHPHPSPCNTMLASNDKAVVKKHLKRAHKDTEPTPAVALRAKKDFKLVFCGECRTWQSLTRRGTIWAHQPCREAFPEPRPAVAASTSAANEIPPNTHRARTHAAIKQARGLPPPPDTPELLTSMPRAIWQGEVGKTLDGLAASLCSEDKDLPLRWYFRLVELGFYERRGGTRLIPRTLRPDQLVFPRSNPEPAPAPDPLSDLEASQPPADDGGISDAIRAAKFASVGKVKQAVSSLEGVQPASLAPAEQVRELLGKFVEQPYGPLPQSPADLIPHGEASVLHRRADLVKEVASFVTDYVASRPPRSARAVSPWSYDLWKEALRSDHIPDAASVARCLARVIVALMAGGANNTSLHRALLDARGIALTKGAGQGSGIRPICVIDPLVRMTSATVLHLTSGALAGEISDYEFGMKTAGGLEALPKGIQAVLNVQPSHCVLELDIRNAFNTVSREHLLNSIHTLARAKGAVTKPEILLPWTDFLLRSPTTVTFRDSSCNRVVRTSMAEGVPQGEVLSPWLYDLWVSHVLAPIRARLNGVAVTGCHDGIFIVGPPSSIGNVYNVIRDAFAPAHQVMNLSKFKLLHLHPTSDTMRLAQDIGVPESQVSRDGLVVAGVPVGTPQFVSENLRGAADKVRSLCKKINDAARQTSPTYLSTDSATGALQGFLLTSRLCLASKVVHLLRALPCTATTAD